MNFTKSMFALAIGSIGIIGAMSATAANLNNGDVLTIVTGETSSSGGATAGTTSWYALDGNGDSKIQLAAEKTPLFPGTDGGIVIGASNTALGAIDAGFPYFGYSGHFFVTTAISGGTSGLDMSGLMLGYGYGYGYDGVINLGDGGAWTPTNALAAGMTTSSFTDKVANFTWDGVYGHGYTLDYTATPQSGAWTGVPYALHLEGVVAVPEASSYGMMLAGLGLVAAVTRRRKQAAI